MFIKLKYKGDNGWVVIDDDFTVSFISKKSLTDEVIEIYQKKHLPVIKNYLAYAMWNAGSWEYIDFSIRNVKNTKYQKCINRQQYNQKLRSLIENRYIKLSAEDQFLRNVYK